MRTWLLSDGETDTSENGEDSGFFGIDFGAGTSQAFGGLMSIPGLIFGSGSAASQAQGHKADGAAAGTGGLVGTTAEGALGATMGLFGGVGEGVTGILGALPGLLMQGGTGLFGGALSAFAGPVQAAIQKSSQRDVIKALTSRKALAAQERLKGLAFRQAFIVSQIEEGDRLARGMEKGAQRERTIRLVGIGGLVGLIVIGGLVAWRVAK